MRPDLANADATLLVVRRMSIELARLAIVHIKLHLLHTLVFDALWHLCRLIPLLDHQPSGPSLDLCRAKMCLVCPYNVLLKWRLIFSTGLPMGLGSLTTTHWLS